MIDRIIEIADDGGRLSIDLGRLTLKREEATVAQVPVKELAVLVLAHPRLSITHPVLDEIARAGGIVVVCDDRRLPSGMLLPLQAFGLPSQRMGLQWTLSVPRRKRIWQRIVQAKIEGQARALEELDGGDSGIGRLVATVRSGDAGNVEGDAARRYWRAMFGPNFRRSRDGGAPNPALNYGYSILRAVVARAICGAGLHPCVGIQHHHRSNPFCLADDLMEPFRPVVDRAVVSCFGRDPAVMPPEASTLDRDARGAIISAVLDRYSVGGESRTLPDLVRRAIHSTVRAMENGTRDFRIEAP